MQKQKLMLKAFLKFPFVFYLSLQTALAHPSWDPTENLFDGPIPCTSVKCVSLEEAVQTAVRNGYPRRENLELLFQSRQRITASLGRLLPRLELSFGPDLFPSSLLGSISNILGIIMPSNWFNWKESKLFYRAQRSSYEGILKNVVTDTETLYYHIHRVARDQKIYEYYGNHLLALVNNLKMVNASNRAEGKAVSFREEEILELTSFGNALQADSQYLSTVLKNWYTYDVAVAMAYPHQEEIGILPIDLPDLNNTTVYSVTEEELHLIKKNSSELAALRYLTRAAHYSKLSRIFSFLRSGGSAAHPVIGLSFGLDNVANVRIAGSEIRFLELERKEASARLESSFRKLVDVYNGSVALYKKFDQSINPNREFLHSVLNNYLVEGHLSTEKLIRAVEWALKFELGRNFVQHLFLITTSQMDKLLMRGERFHQLTSVIPPNQALDRRRDRIKIKENGAIDGDIRKGILDLENP